MDRRKPSMLVNVPRLVTASCAEYLSKVPH
jgi:hypothetical protein